MNWKPDNSGHEETKGAKGIVTGKHGGIELIFVDFKSEVLEKLVLADRILVKLLG